MKKTKTTWADNPQAAEIDALIEQAGRLTEREIMARITTKDKAEVAARAAAKNAGRGTASDDIWTKTQRAVGAEPRYWLDPGDSLINDAAYDAGYAVIALLARDLIDESTDWNQAAYNLLVADWVALVGPLHPDDYDTLREFAFGARMTHTDVLRSLVRLLGSEEIGDQVRRSTAIAGGATR